MTQNKSGVDQVMYKPVNNDPDGIPVLPTVN